MSNVSRSRAVFFRIACCAALATAMGCGGPGVNSDEEARRAYLGLDLHIDKAITLGFRGFNAATSANITQQIGSGDKNGIIAVSGQVDQGSSANKGMRLVEELMNYTDDGKLFYTTSSPASLSMQLKNIPSGTLTGTLVGQYDMTGELMGAVTLNLSFSGELQPNATDMTKVERKPGTTHITGSALSPAGTYQVDVTR